MLMNFISHISKVIIDFISSVVTQVNIFLLELLCRMVTPFQNLVYPVRQQGGHLEVLIVGSLKIIRTYDEKQTVKCVYRFCETNMSFDEAHFQNGKS